MRIAYSCYIIFIYMYNICKYVSINVVVVVVVVVVIVVVVVVVIVFVVSSE